MLVDDKAGVLGNILQVIAKEGYNIKRTVQIEDHSERAVVEIQIGGKVDEDSLTTCLTQAGFVVDSIQHTVAKKI